LETALSLRPLSVGYLPHVLRWLPAARAEVPTLESVTPTCRGKRFPVESSKRPQAVGIGDSKANTVGFPSAREWRVLLPAGEHLTYIVRRKKFS
jgi:hypothetical protein